MPFDPLRPLVFTHIAKSSGMAITKGLMDALAPRHPVAGFDPVMFGGFQAFDSLSASVHRTIHHDPATLPRAADFIHGHFSVSTTSTAYPHAQFITILREPRVRLLSLWRYWRAQTPTTLQGWGDWILVVARSQQSLAEFLEDTVVACQTDNMALRMLLWPHRLIPDDGFIEPCHDSALLEQAHVRLLGFDHLDIVENPRLADNFGDWLGRAFEHPVINETASGSVSPSLPLHLELSDRCLDALDSRSRLDRQLWQTVVAQRMPDQDVERWRERTMLRAIARYCRT